MPQRRKKDVRVTAARVEVYLDKLAEIMARSGDEAYLMVPLWKRMEQWRDELSEAEAIVSAALDRVRRSDHRTAGRSA